MTRLYLIRHAQAAEPGDVRLPGPDLPLTKVGRDQSEALGRRLRRHRPSALFTSDAARARETAAIVVATSGDLAPHVSIERDLREVDFGEWGGRTYRDVVAEQPLAVAYFADPGAGTPPRGEPVAAVAARVTATLHRITEVYPGDAVAIVGHAGSLRLAVAAALGLPLSHYWRLRLDCAALCVVDLSDDGAVIVSWNDVGHLEARDPIE